MRLKSVEKSLKKLLIPRYNSKVLAAKIMAPYPKVIDGSFAGMKYVSGSVGSKYYPKILGIYEQEIHHLVEDVTSKKYSKILNVGAAEGYFSVGMALRMPKAQIVAFEMDAEGQMKIEELAKINNVSDQISILGECGIKDLCKELAPDSLVFMDVEGAEDFLLNPAECDGLKQCDILVEVHEHLVPGVNDKLKNWYSNTHKLEVVDSVKRSADDLKLPINLSIDQKIINYLTFGFLKRKTIRRLVDEYREVPNQWYYLTKK